MSRKSRVNGKMYCANYLKNDIACMICIEQAIFRAKSCYKESFK